MRYWLGCDSGGGLLVRAPLEGDRVRAERISISHKHCSLKALSPLGADEGDALMGVMVPATIFTICTVSIYEMDRMRADRVWSISV